MSNHWEAAMNREQLASETNSLLVIKIAVEYVIHVELTMHDTGLPSRSVQ